MHAQHLPIMVALFIAAFARAADAPRWFAARDVRLQCTPANGTTVDSAELYVSRDSGRTWQPVPDAWREGALHYTAPEDARYDFYVILRNAAGSSGEPPAAGTLPAVSLLIDTTAPLLQVHQVTADPLAEPPAVALAMTLVEEHLADDAIRVFWRGTHQLWIDGGMAQHVDGGARWVLPPDLPEATELRVIVTDRAGNQSWSDPLPFQRTVSAGASTPDAPVVPASDEPVPETAPSPPSHVPGPASQPARHDVTQLRELAGRFMQEGRYALAAARYEDALGAGPADPDLLVDLGSALYRAGRYDDAAARFNTALSGRPDHVGAIEGLALVAATQKRYPQAREQLLRLQKLQPDVASVWLRSGDIEHKLGSVGAAREAWQRALRAPDADAVLRAKAQRRLEYFGVDGSNLEPAQESWPGSKQPSRPSSSSTVTSRTRS
jgi:hypothetical protein